MTPARIMQQRHSFAKAVMPPDVHPIQVQEMRRAFFAGARAMLTLAETLTHGVSEEAGAAVLQEMEDELKEFSGRVRTGEF